MAGRVQDTGGEWGALLRVAAWLLVKGCVCVCVHEFIRVAVLHACLLLLISLGLVLVVGRPCTVSVSAPVCSGSKVSLRV